MLPRKWKTFRIISYLHLAVTIAVSTLMYYALMQSGLPSVRTFMDLLAVLFIIICPASLVINCILNLNLLDKYYPASIPGKKHRIWSRVLFILTLFSLTTLAFLTAAGASSIVDVREQTLRRMWPIYTFVLSALVIAVTGCYVLWNQVSLRKALRRNHKVAMENFLEQEEPIQP